MAVALHAQCKAFLEMLAAAGGPPLEQLPIEDARAVPKLMLELAGPEEPVASVEDRAIPGPGGPIPIRIYRPTHDPDLAGLLFFHGGGFVICNLDSHDRQCRQLARASGCTVVAVDYRLAPEHTFPAAAEDAYAATRYVAEHARELGIARDRIGVSGDSAGGNLATVAALMARDRGGPPLRFQLLIYPWVDMDDDSSSMRQYGHDHFLSREAIDWFAGQYFASTADRRQPYASPARAADLSRLPPAMVITAECDPLRDQGEAYARQLQAAGVPVELKRYDGMIHPFLSLGGVVDAGRTAIVDAGSAVRRAMGTAAASGA
jgi:acetyl esterase